MEGRLQVRIPAAALPKPAAGRPRKESIEHGHGPATHTQRPTYITAASLALVASPPSSVLAALGFPQEKGPPEIPLPSSAPAAAIAGDERARHAVHGSRGTRHLVAFLGTGACGAPRRDLPIQQSRAPNPTVLATAAASGVPAPSSPGHDRPPAPPPPRLPRRGGSPPQLFPLAGETRRFNLGWLRSQFRPASFE
jgi:hypothetical protein